MIENHTAHPSLSQFRRSITREASLAAGFQPGSWQEKLFSTLFFFPAHQFAKLGKSFDEDIARCGLGFAAEQIIANFVTQVKVQGAENIPQDGPLIIASNHPGAFDGLVIIAQIKRDDLKLIVSDVPITRNFRETSRHLIYSTGVDHQERMTAVRQSLRHLGQGGSLLLFPTGLVDPDPAFMSGADQALKDWSPSLEYFMRKIPGASLLPVIVSGVLAPEYLDHWLARRQKSVRAQQKVAEYLEVAHMIMFSKKLKLVPCITFGVPLSTQDLIGEKSEDRLNSAINEAVYELLMQHLAMFPPSSTAL